MKKRLNKVVDKWVKSRIKTTFDGGVGFEFGDDQCMFEYYGFYMIIAFTSSPGDWSNKESILRISVISKEDTSNHIYSQDVHYQSSQEVLDSLAEFELWLNSDFPR
jgi:hypothetical protein